MNSDIYPQFYRCPCGCGWVRDDPNHLANHLASTGYGLNAIKEVNK